METKAVVAIWLEFEPNEGVGAVGVPVKEGDAIVARNNISEVFVVILFVFEVILFDKDNVSAFKAIMPFL